MTAIAPTTSSHRKYRLPCLVILPSLSLPPVVYCLGTSPIQAARLRPDPNAFQSPIGNQRGGADRADAGDLRQPPTRLTGPVQDHDVLVDGFDLSADRAILPRQHLENVAYGRRHPAISFTLRRFRSLATTDNPVVLATGMRVAGGMRMAGVPDG